MSEKSGRVSEIILDEHSVVRRSPDIEHERAVAIYDLLEENSFAPTSGATGPFHLHLSIEESRLIFGIHDEADRPLDRVPLPILPFRRIVKDYFTVCESYFAAIKTATPAQIEALDVGRRALHDEGGELLRERLAESIELDFNTGRRLFTLLCVLHISG